MPRDVGLRLVVVVVGDKVLDGVLGEEVLELRIQLGAQRLVVGEDQRRPLHAGDDVGDGERLARPGRAQQDLMPVPLFQAGHQRIDCLRLIPRRLIDGPQFELGHVCLEQMG